MDYLVKAFTIQTTLTTSPFRGREALLDIIPPPCCVFHSSIPQATTAMCSSSVFPTKNARGLKEATGTMSMSCAFCLAQLAFTDSTLLSAAESRRLEHSPTRQVEAQLCRQCVEGNDGLCFPNIYS